MRFLKEERIEAYQWHKNGDHPKDNSVLIPGPDGDFLSEGEVIGFYPYPDDKDKVCEKCDRPFSEHGKIGIDLAYKKSEIYGPQIVCPGAWVQTHNITHTQGGPEKYTAFPVHFNPSKEYQSDFHIKAMETPKVDELENLKARLLWYVKLDKTYCPVYDVPGYHHYGRENGDVDTWWVQYGSSMHPYSDRHTNRICFEYNFREYNSTKIKWDDLRINRGVSVTITANDKPFYQFNAHKLDYAFAKAQTLVVQMMEHPYNFLTPEEEKGRKIYFYGLPATVRPSSHPGEIGIIPDYTTGIAKSEWWRMYNLRRQPVGGEPDKEWAEIEASDAEENEHNDYINWGDAMSDGNINWFRK